MRRLKPNLAVFVGSDISSQIAALRLASWISRSGGRLLFIDTGLRPPSPDVASELHTIFKLERWLLHRIAYPWLTLHTRDVTLIPPRVHRAPANSFEYMEVSDVNNPDFIHQLHARSVQIGLSIRCYQKFGAPLINYFRQLDGGAPRFFNLHPGILPSYRGVITFLRALANSDESVGYTLHEVNSSWDAGAIVAQHTIAVKHGMSAFGHMMECLDGALDSTCQIIETICSGQRVSSAPQNAENARYFSFPSANEFADFASRGIVYISPADAVSAISSNFSQSGTPHYTALVQELYSGLSRYQFIQEEQHL